MKRRLQFDSLENRRLLAGNVVSQEASESVEAAEESARPVLTVISHGLTAKTDANGDLIFPFQPGEFPLWAYDMATAVYARGGQAAGTDDLNNDGIIDVIQNAKIDLDLNQPAVGDGQAWDDLILFDWTQQSVTAGTANSNGVAGVLKKAVSSRLIELGAGPIDVHFVGFSRGAFVTVDAIRRLGADGGADAAADRIGRLQMTTLDPQPFHGLFDSDGELESNPGGIVDWADNYYQQAGTGFFDEGEPINGAYNVDLSNILRAWPGRNNANLSGVLNHSEVHDWYHWTIDPIDDQLGGYLDADLAAQDNVLVNSPQLGHRGILFPNAPWENGAKVGYYWSKIGGGQNERPSPWRNDLDFFDVDGDGNFNNADILTLVSLLRNSDGGGKLAVLQTETELYDPPLFPDINGDLLLTHNDALQGVSHLRHLNALQLLIDPDPNDRDRW